MTSVRIIAEAGVNHNGNLDLAKKLIDVAASAGADYVKFQTFKTERLVSKSAPKAAYQIKNLGNSDESQFDMIKKLELDANAHKILIEYCIQKNISFLSTPFDLESVDMLYDLGLKIFKIPSGEITNLPLLRKIGGLNQEIILSTGMCTIGEIESALCVLEKAGTPKDKMLVLHCNTEYPTPIEDVNLHAMNTIGDTFKVKVGYSDHTLGLEVPVAAVALGAKCIEKHFTLDRKMKGPDHKSSLEPDTFRKMVRYIRNIEKALGNGIKEPSFSERKNIMIARKSIHLAHKLPADHVLMEYDLVMKRPGDGISPMDMEMLIGKMIKTALPADHKLSLSDLVF